MEFSTIQGDIAQERADALVNAAGTSLRMGSGVAGAATWSERSDQRGGGLEGANRSRWCRHHRRVRPRCRGRIHAAAMPHYGDDRATAQGIRDSTQNALAKADDLEYTSIVLPLLGTCAVGFDVDRGALLMCEEIDRYEPKSLEDVRVIAHEDHDFEALKESVKKFV